MNRKSAVVLTLLSGGLMLLSSVPVWVQAETVSALGPKIAVGVTGGDAASGVLGAGLAILAAGIAGGLVGRLGRWIVMAVIFLGSAIVVVSAIGVFADPESVALAAAAKETGVAQIIGGAQPTLWPGVALVLGIAGFALCVTLLRSSAAWTTVSSRHDRVETSTRTPDRTDLTAEPQEDATSLDDAELWDSQTRGEQD